MKKQYTSVLFLILLASFCFSQKETEKWYFSGGGALDFSSGVPVSLNNSVMGTSFEGCASLADANGNLLFYADGTSKIYVKNHTTPPNGSGLFMGNSVTQGSIFVPKPGSATIYYLIHIGGPTLFSTTNLYYSEIDITLNGGNGDVTANKNISIASSFGNCSEKMAVTKHCNGIDYWVLVHDYLGDAYKAYLITAAGINTVPVVSNVGTPFVSLSSDEDARGQMKISPNGTKVATAYRGIGQLEVCDFNKATGVVSNARNLGSIGPVPYGVEFSPDNSKVYATEGSNFVGTVYQWDLSAGTTAAIAASKVAIVNSAYLNSLQLAPDGKIYGTASISNLAVINNPNIAGTGSNYAANGVSIAPQFVSVGLPSFISSYFDKPTTFSYVTSSSQVNATGCQNNGSATVSISPVFGLSPYTYTWSNNTVDGPTTNLTSSVSNLSAGTYSVVITDATCLIDTAYFTVLGGSPSPTTQNISICNGNGYTLPGGTTVFVAGTYNDTLIGASVGGCDSIVVTNLTVGSSVNQTLNPIVCFGNNYTLPSGGIVTSTGVYADTIQSGACDSIFTVNLTVLPALTSSQSATICSGNSFTLPGGTQVTTAGTYTDTIPGSGGCDSIIITNLTVSTSLTGNQSPTICSGNSFTLPGGTQVTTAGTYTDTIPGSGGCDSIITTNLSISPSSSSTQNQSICSGDFYPLPGGGMATMTGVYTDTLSSSAGCDSIIITNLTVLSPSNSMDNPVICSNENYFLPDGTIVNVAGTYTSVIAAANGCDSVITINLNVNPAPTASISPDITIIMGTSTTLTATGGVTYSWLSTTGLNTTTGNSVTASPTSTTTYCVVVTDANGCIDTACVTVNVEIPCPKSENLGMPNAFSPNGDNINDEFCLQGWEDCIEGFNIRIYDRWGEKVFESFHSDFCWDGKYKGTTMDAQVLVYYLKATYKNNIVNTVLNKSGNISLIR